jgi:hypothetical protein
VRTSGAPVTRAGDDMEPGAGITRNGALAAETAADPGASGTAATRASAGSPTAPVARTSVPDQRVGDGGGSSSAPTRSEW